MDQPHTAAQEEGGGLLATLPVATPSGWRAAGRLQVGDPVWCLDAPPQRIRWLRHNGLRAPGLVRVDEGALGNPGPVALLPDQAVALDLDQAAVLYGDPVALVPARALVGWRGITWQRAPSDIAVQVRFDRGQVIYAGPGLLLGCPGLSTSLAPAGPPAPPLTAEQAHHLMACVMAEDIGAALRPRRHATF